MKIAPIFLKYDYGIRERGESLEKRGFLPALQQVAEKVVPFWMEDNGFWEDKALLQKKIIKFIDDEKPDIAFFILMKDEVWPSTIEYLSKKYITVNWFCDDQWRFDTFTKYIAPKLTYSITTDKYSLAKYYSIGYKNVIFSQWASYEYVDHINFDNINYKYDISFIGTKNATREWIINSLIRKGYKVECFGVGWENGRVSYEDIKSIFLNSKINLNLSNSISNDIRYLFSSFKSAKYFLRSQKRIEQIKARNFEIPSLGGFQLTNYAPGIEDYFTIGQDIAIYTNLEDLDLQTRYYLENDAKRKEMTISAYKKARSYTYKENIKKITEEIKSYS